MHLTFIAIDNDVRNDDDGDANDDVNVAMFTSMLLFISLALWQPVVSNIDIVSLINDA